MHALRSSALRLVRLRHRDPGPAHPPVAADDLRRRARRHQAHALTQLGQRRLRLIPRITQHREHHSHAGSVTPGRDWRQGNRRIRVVRWRAHNQGMTEYDPEPVLNEYINRVPTARQAVHNDPLFKAHMSPFGGILQAMLEPPDGGPPYTLTWVPTEPEEPAAPSRPLSRRERERFGRRIAAVFDVPPWMLGIGVQPLAINGHAYHRRQRNRIKRRRR